LNAPLRLLRYGAVHSGVNLQRLLLKLMKAESFFCEKSVDSFATLRRHIQEDGSRYCHRSENLTSQTSDISPQISKFNFWAPYVTEIIMQIAATGNGRNSLQQ